MATQVIRTSSGFVKAEGRAKYFGYDVTVITATGPINLRDGGASGTIRAVIPAATAVGASQNKNVPIDFQAGIYAEFADSATGTVGFLFE